MAIRTGVALWKCVKKKAASKVSDVGSTVHLFNIEGPKQDIKSILTGILRLSLNCLLKRIGTSVKAADLST
jgi:hypothetical protein